MDYEVVWEHTMFSPVHGGNCDLSADKSQLPPHTT